MDQLIADQECATCGAGVGPGTRYCSRCNTPIGEPAVRPGARTYRIGTLGLVTCAAIVAVAVAELGYALWPAIAWWLAATAATNGDSSLIFVAFIVDAVLALVALVLLLTAGVLMIVWTYRARVNLDAFPGAGASMGRGWAIAGWLVPIANFFVPYRVMANIVRDSLWQFGKPVLVQVWWAAFLSYQILSYLGGQLEDLAFTELPDPVGRTAFAAYRDVFADILLVRLMPALAGVVAAVAIVLIVRRVGLAQQTRLARTWPGVTAAATQVSS
ncbi:DUF4328 domain-containing protein [Micromonospora sp. NBC_01813]|uniref:DUF4328 domain-containing protein n=1 Tax=Micromonospora sp. NBC_01813 TaxID=2975988 RepID=UPI002DD959E0|nr:DUF4328 domain-containing protein [Micromonospora sp. NBC_01813]WSA08365.1 DUF4328 domain-containing protein [Micromonospora sp. NBC_01813]